MYVDFREFIWRCLCWCLFIVLLIVFWWIRWISRNCISGLSWCLLIMLRILILSCHWIASSALLTRFRSMGIFMLRAFLGWCSFSPPILIPTAFLQLPGMIPSRLVLLRPLSNNYHLSGLIFAAFWAFLIPWADSNIAQDSDLDISQFPPISYPDSPKIFQSNWQANSKSSLDRFSNDWPLILKSFAALI